MLLSNAGVTSLSGGGGITISGSTGSITLGSNASSGNTPGAIVLRNLSGDFSAGTISANLLGNAATATTAFSALLAVDFSGALLGDVTGTQGATVVANVGGMSAANLASAAILANAAVPASTPGALVRRDVNGNFTGATISATEFAGGGAGLTGVGGTLPWQTVSGVAQQAVANRGYLATDAAAVTITLPAAASAGDIVRVSGVGAGGWAIVPNAGQSVIGFAAGLGPAGSQGAGGAVQFIGNNSWQPLRESQIANGAVGTAQLAPGALDNTKLVNSSITVSAGAGLDGGGTVALGGTVLLSNAGVTSLSAGGGITISGSTGSITLGSNASSVNTPGAIVLRNLSGDFSAGTISANLLGNATTATTAFSALFAVDFGGALSGDVTGRQAATVVATVGGMSAANLASGALLANAAVAASTPGTLVRRDVNGNFTGATISATEFAGGGAGLTGVGGTLPWQTVSGP